MPVKPAGSRHAIFRQVCELIPSHLVPKLARKHGVRSRDITPWSHVVGLLGAGPEWSPTRLGPEFGRRKAS